MKKYIKYLVIAFVTIIILGSYYFFVPIYYDKDNKTIILNVNEEYNDEVPSVYFHGRKIKAKQINNTVDISKLGEYYIDYDISPLDKYSKVLRKNIRVIDLESPKLELMQEESIIDYGSAYKEIEYRAIDNYDGDITNKVKISSNLDTSKIGSYEIIYEIEDSSSNKTLRRRNIHVKDISAPQIKINRNINSYAIIGTKIDINDCTAFDNYDKDVTNKVLVSGNVNFNKEGLYKIKYFVSDSSNNKTEVITTINVQPKNTKGIPVLMYHFFWDDEKSKDENYSNLFMAKTDFENQLKYLRENNYYFPTWEELYDYINSKIKLPKKSVILTADDGNETFYKIALPLIQKYKVPVTSFVVADRSAWKEYKDEEYLHFESHSYSMHKRICKGVKWDGAVMCSKYDELYKDVSSSIKVIGNKNAFAYPFGQYNNSIIKALKENGIKMAFTTNKGRVKPGANKYKLPRVLVHKGISLKEFIGKL